MSEALAYRRPTYATTFTAPCADNNPLAAWEGWGERATMQPKLRPQGRIKEKYSPTPTARERAYHLWLIDTFPCACGCGAASTVVHHPLTRHPRQRWRRDHEFVVPMDYMCHRELHAAGDEKRWKPELMLADAAFWNRHNAMELGKL